MLKPMYVLVGSDLFLQLEALKELLKNAPRDVQRADFDGETAQVGDVLDELNSFAMFSTAKVVVVRSADEFVRLHREDLEERLASAKVPEGSALVLRLNSLPKNQRIYRLISSRGAVIECNPPANLATWIIDRARNAHKLAMGITEANLLADLIGPDLGKLDSELAKLAIQCDGRADSASILRSVSFQREQEMWRMTDEVAAGHTARALQRWQQLMQTDPSSEYRAITWLTMWLEKARKALALRKAGQSDSSIAYELKVFPRDKQVGFFKTLDALGESGVQRMIDLLAELDYRSKQGLGNMCDNVEKFILAAKA